MLRTDRPDYRRSKEDGILEGLRSQDPLALAEAYHRTGPAAHACARRLLGGAVHAEALLTAVYADLWADPPETPRLEGWVRSRCFRLASEHLRERQEPPAAPSLALLLPDLPRPQHTSRDPVEQALAALSERERRALLLAHDQGMPTTAQDDPGAADALGRALIALAGPGAGLGTGEQCEDLPGMADWILGLLEADHAERIGSQVLERRTCVERSQALRRGRRRLEGLPPAPDMGQRVLATVLSGTPAAVPGHSAPPPPPAATEDRPRDSEARGSTLEQSSTSAPPPAFFPPAAQQAAAEPSPEPPAAEPTAQPPAVEPSPEPPAAEPTAQPPAVEPPPEPPTAEPPPPEPPAAREQRAQTEPLIPFAPLPSALDEEPTVASSRDETSAPLREGRDETDLDEVAATDTAALPAREPAADEDVRADEVTRADEQRGEREAGEDYAVASPAEDVSEETQERTRDTDTRDRKAEVAAPEDRKLVRQLLNILAIVVVLAAGGALGLLIGFLLIGGG